MSDEQSHLGAQATKPCGRCGQPLDRRGENGECLRCLMRFALAAGNDAEPAEDLPSPPLSAASVETTWRYGHYEIVPGSDGLPWELGAGAMATTYRARDRVLGSTVALKVINRAAARHPEARARFLREARAAAQLRHPNIANVTHYGEQDAECFYAMELVEGETLEQKVRRDGPLPAAEALEIVAQVARALAAAEAMSVVHRDLKPSNLMLVSIKADGVGSNPAGYSVKVIDWGLAKAVSDPAVPGLDDTQSGFLGTPAFASPEQFTAATLRRLDTRSDIFSLGVTLWYLLTGQTPFLGRDLEEVHARQRAGVLPTEQLAAARVPKPVVALLRRMLALEPAARPQTARELLIEIGRCQRRRGSGWPEGSRCWWLPVAGGAAAIGGWLAWWHIGPGGASPISDKSVAILPFENVSPNIADEELAARTQNEVVADLSRSPELKVIGTASSRFYPPHRRDLPAVARELGVRYLLEGETGRANGQLSVTVHLTDTQPPSGTWNRQLTGTAEAGAALPEEIARTVAARFQVALPVSGRASPSGDPVAYDLYLRAREGPVVFTDITEPLVALRTRIDLLDQAVARDPNFALAYCELAKAHDRLFAAGRDAATLDPQVDHRTLADVALSRARRLQPDAGELHLAQAVHFFETSPDDAQARAEIDLARHALPNDAETEELAGEIARREGRWDDALRSLRRATTLDPHMSDPRFMLAKTYRLLRRYDEFDRTLAELIAQTPPAEAVSYRLYRTLGPLEDRADLAPLRAALADPGTRAADVTAAADRDFYTLLLAVCSHDADAASRLLAATSQTQFRAGGMVYPKTWFEGLAAWMRGDEAAAHAAFAAARLEVEKMVLTNPASGRIASLLALIDALLGRREEALAEALRARDATVERLSATEAPALGCSLAQVYALTGQPGPALTELARWKEGPAGSSVPGQPTVGDLRLNPLWTPLRDDPRFVAILR